MTLKIVMPAHPGAAEGRPEYKLVAGIHALIATLTKTWMAGTSPAMTSKERDAADANSARCRRPLKKSRPEGRDSAKSGRVGRWISRGPASPA